MLSAREHGLRSFDSGGGDPDKMPLPSGSCILTPPAENNESAEWNTVLWLTLVPAHGEDSRMPFGDHILTRETNRFFRSAH